VTVAERNEGKHRHDVGVGQAVSRTVQRASRADYTSKVLAVGSGR